MAKNIPVSEMSYKPDKLRTIHILDFVLGRLYVLDFQFRPEAFKVIILLFLVEILVVDWLVSGLCSLVVMNAVVDLFVLFYVRDQLFGELLGILVHVVLYFLKSKCYGV